MMAAKTQIKRRRFLKAMAFTAGSLYLPCRLSAQETPLSNQAAGSFLNPILKGDYPDPSIVRVGGQYYMTHSANTYCPAFLVWKSANLTFADLASEFDFPRKPATFAAQVVHTSGI
jgi:hypothetical protein